MFSGPVASSTSTPSFRMPSRTRLMRALNSSSVKADLVVSLASWFIRRHPPLAIVGAIHSNEPRSRRRVNGEQRRAMDIKIRKYQTTVEEIHHEGGPPADKPVKHGAVCAVVHNPFAGRYEANLMDFMEAL